MTTQKIKYKIEHYPKLSTGDYSSTPNIIEESINWDEDLSIEATADTFMFKVVNINRRYSTNSGDNFTFDVDDKIKIYVKTGTTDFTDDDLLITGIIGEVKHELNESTREILVRGTNLLERLLSCPKTSTAGNVPAYQHIINLLGQYDDENPKKRFFQSTTTEGRIAEWENILLNDGSTNDDTSLRNNTTNIQYSYSEYKPIIEHIEQLSKKEINKDGDFIFYLDKNWKFHWNLKTTTPEKTLIEGEDFRRIVAKKSIWEVVTAIIVDCGKDPDGWRILAVGYHEKNAAEYGLRWSPARESLDISSGLLNKCRESSGWTAGTESNYPSASDYPFTMPWKASHTHKIGGFFGREVTVGDDVIVENDSEFRSEIRAEARFQGKQWIQSFLENAGKARWKIDITTTGSHWSDPNGLNKPSIGVMHWIEAPSIGDFTGNWSGDNRHKARLVHVSHNLDRRGWTVDLHFEDDIEFVPLRVS